MSNEDKEVIYINNMNTNKNIEAIHSNNQIVLNSINSSQHFSFSQSDFKNSNLSSISHTLSSICNETKQVRK